MALAYGVPIKDARTLPPDPNKLYRVEAVSYSYIRDAEADDYGSTAPRLEVFAFDVARFTQHGATLTVKSGARPKWVDLREGSKQWASRTVEEAVTQLAMRRRSQLHVLGKQMARAEFELKLTVDFLTRGVDAVSGLPHMGGVSNERLPQ